MSLPRLPGQAGRPRLLVTGASGLVGWNLCRMAVERFETWGTYNATPMPADDERWVRIDLLAGRELEALVERLKPRVVVHAAAMTRPEDCERNRDLARRLNTDLARRLARACKDRGARMIHLSTDLVFDGRKGGRYIESDRVNPISFYGNTKASAEESVARALHDHVILRSALIYGRSMTGDRGASERAIRSVRDRGKVTLFTDEYRTPILADDLCAAILRLAESDVTGIFHAGGSERISRWEFGRRLAERAGLNPGAVAAASVRDFTGTPPRAPDVSLDSTKLMSLFDLAIRGVDDGLGYLHP